jgi:hypothetical protein
MILNSPVLTSRVLEMLDERERALGDAIAAESGTDNPQQRLVAALLASVHRVLSAEATTAAWPGSPARKSVPCWTAPPPALSTCSSRPSAATASARREVDSRGRIGRLQRQAAALPGRSAVQNAGLLLLELGLGQDPRREQLTKLL